MIAEVTVNRAVLALGANVSGALGEPIAALRQIVSVLISRRVYVTKVSWFFATKPDGGCPQPDYLNIVLVAHCSMPPAQLIRLFKSLERSAGRRRGRRNGPRPLDIDLIDFGGRVIAWPARCRRPHLVLPHPEMHKRGFVLAPLAQIVPHWRHPVLDLSVRQLLAKLPPQPHSVKPLFPFSDGSAAAGCLSPGSCDVWDAI